MQALQEREVNTGFKENAHRRSLSDEIDYLRANWKQEGLPFDWASLPDTGFQMHRQTALLREELTESFDLREGLDRWLDKTREDVKGFVLEYLNQGLVFPIFLRKRIVDGQERIVAPLYGDKLLVDTVLEEERGGVVKKTLEETTEPLLLNARDGDIVAQTSPDGFSGLKDAKGREIVYPDSQTYIFQVRGDDIVGFTIRTDFKIEEHREMLRRLTGKMIDPNTSAYDLLKEVVHIDRDNSNIGTIENVIGVMRDVRFDHSGGSLNAFKNRMWNEAYRDIKRRDELWRFTETTKKIFDEFRDLVLTENLTEYQIKEALAVTILRMAKFIRGERGPFMQIRENTQRSVLKEEPVFHGALLKEIQEIPGCAGGGGASSISSITPRSSEIVDILKCVKCPFCKETVDAILTSNEIICPRKDCGKSAKRN